MSESRLPRTLNRLRNRFLPKRPSEPILDSPFTESHEERRRLMLLYWSYFLGYHNKPLAIRPDEPDLNAIENWSKEVVNSSVNLLMGGGLSFKVEDEAQQAYLDWQYADDPEIDFSWGKFTYTLAQSGTVTGQPIVMIDTGSYAKPKPIVINAQDVDVVIIERQVVEYHIYYFKGDDWFRTNISMQQAENSADIFWQVQEERRKGKLWTAVDEPVTWPFEFPPIVTDQNLPSSVSMWGLSDLIDASMNDTINLQASDINKILFVHGHPITVAKNMVNQQVAMDNQGGSRLVKIPDGADLSNLELQSDLTASRENKSNIVDSYHQITDTPNLTGTNVQVGAVSGFALQILMGPALAKMEQKRSTYGSLFNKLNYSLLRLSGVDDPALVKNVWGNPLPANRPEQVQEFDTLVRSGVSVENALMQAFNISRADAEAMAATAVMIPASTPIERVRALANGNSI